MWGSAAFSSCDGLLERLERQDDPSLTDIIILPGKKLTDANIVRLSRNVHNHPYWRSWQASGQALSLSNYELVGTIVRNNPRLQILKIGNVEMKDDGVCALCRGLTENSMLQELDLSYKTMGVQGFQALINILGRSKHLNKLDLSRNINLGNFRVDWKGEELFPALRELDLSDCNVGIDFLETLLLKILLQPQSNLRLLRLSNNTGIGDEGFRLLMPASEKLEELSLSNCNIGDDALTYLTSTPIEFHLQKLDMSNNRIRRDGALCLACLLEDNKSTMGVLRELNLSYNSLTFEGVEQIAKSLATRTTPLQSLDMSNTNCGDGGAAALIQHGRLMHLRLFENELGSSGFQTIAPLLKEGHPTLVTLDLAGNYADQMSVVKLLEGLLHANKKSTLRTVIVGGNDGGEQLEEMIKQIQELQPELDIARDKVKR